MRSRAAFLAEDESRASAREAARAAAARSRSAETVVVMGEVYQRRARGAGTGQRESGRLGLGFSFRRTRQPGEALHFVAPVMRRGPASTCCPPARPARNYAWPPFHE